MPLENNYKYLHIANFKDIPNWSVQYVDEDDLGFTKKYPMVKIGTFLTKSTNIIDIRNDEEYKQLTIKINNGGVVPRNKGILIKGSEIGTRRQTVAHAGQFVMSKIDARNGAYGIVPEELDGAIVTNDFPVFDVDIDIILPQFMVLISTTPQFVEFARKCSSGTTNRKRIDIKTFLQQAIPLPGLEEQKEIIYLYNKEISEIHDIEQEAGMLKEHIQLFWYDKLGINNNKKHKIASKHLCFIHSKSISQWGVDFISENEYKERYSKLYTSDKIKNLCKIGSGGTPNRNHKEYFQGNIPWIKTGELNDEELLFTEEKITEDAIKNSSAKMYSKDSLIIAMYGATIGKTAKLGINATTNQACAVLYDIDNSRINTDFLWFYLQTQTTEFKRLAYGGAQPNINAGIIANYLIPLPVLSIQEDMVSYTRIIREKINGLRTNAIKKRAKIVEKINQLIFE